MTFVAATSAFENPAPTTFQQLAGLWDVLRWSVPAMLIGTMVTRRVMTVAAAVSLISGLILLAFEYSGFVPTGEDLPDSMYFWGVAIELGAGVVIAALAAMVAKTARRWMASRLYISERRLSPPE